MKINELVQHNQKWFSEENKAFFKDVEYFVMHGEKSEQPFLVRSTYAWTDMFGHKPKLHYRVNPIEDCFHIGSLTDDVFEDLDAVEMWLEDN